MALNSGAITSSGTAGTVAVNFPATHNSSSVGATAAVMVNNATNTNDGTFNISSLTVGPLTGRNVAFNNMTIQPGVRYNMTIKLVPQDSFFDDTTSVPGVTLKAARIGGKVWMRYNLGVDPVTNTNSDLTNPTNPGLFGNYYQWGRLLTQANGFTNENVIIGWDRTTTPPANSWNTGTEAAPVKTPAAPYPANYRGPTTTEFQNLANATTQANTNDTSWDNSSTTNYRSIKVFTSKRDKNVKLSFPAPGYRSDSDGSLVAGSRGALGIYWTSTPLVPAQYKNVQLYKNNIDFTSGANIPNFGENIRCIRITN